MKPKKIAVLLVLSILIAVIVFRLRPGKPSPSANPDAGMQEPHAASVAIVIPGTVSGVPAAEPGTAAPRRRMAVDRARSDAACAVHAAAGSEPDPKEPVQPKTGDGTEGDGTGEDAGIRIVRISVSEACAENTEIVMTSETGSASPAFAGEFRLEGNGSDAPCCLMVRTMDAVGKEFVQYLPWNADRPNAFQTLSPMHGRASIGVYRGSRLMGRFTVVEFTGEESIPLDLNADRNSQLASL